MAADRSRIRSVPPGVLPSVVIKTGSGGKVITRKIPKKEKVRR